MISVFVYCPVASARGQQFEVMASRVGGVPKDVMGFLEAVGTVQRGEGSQ